MILRIAPDWRHVDQEDPEEGQQILVWDEDAEAATLVIYVRDEPFPVAEWWAPIEIVGPV